MRHRESDMQINCVRWFGYQYPAYSSLLEHPKNEGNGNRVQGRIAKAEGVRAGVADLILHVPSYINEASVNHSDVFQSLAIEMKTKIGRQSPEQKIWQRYFEAAGGKYIIVRSYDDFVAEVSRYMLQVPSDVDERVKKLHSEIEREADQKALQEYQKIIKG